MKRVKLAVFISGRGSNMLSILEAAQNPDFPAEISVVLSNKSTATGIESAKKHGIATEIVEHQHFDSREDFEDEIQERLEKHDIDFIVLAGFMRILSENFVTQWHDRILNIHPSLLPEYKGLNTHERAITDGKTETGCTVHFVTSDLDSGPIILQKKVPILKDDTPESLAQRVLEQEHIAYPEAIKLIASSV